MISNSRSEVDNNETFNSLNPIQESGHTSKIQYSGILSNHTSDCSLISKKELSSSHFPINKSVNSNISSEEPKEEEGVFSQIFNYIKNNLNPWKIEEEEVIDAHGFKCKRPKTKIPLRKKQDSYEDEVRKVGGNSLSYATKNSGFGNLFL